MIDFQLPDEIAGLEAELRRFAENDLRPKIREFESTGSWDDGTLKTLDAFAVPGLDLPEDWGGAGAGVLAKVIGLEAVAFGDAGGLLAADPLGASGAAVVACPDGDLAREVAAACLAREARSVLVFGEATGAPWLPGREAPRWTWISDGVALALLGTADCSIEPSAAGALHASGGIALDLSGARTLGEWTLTPDAALGLRGRARLVPAAIAIGVASASLEYAMAYAQERVVMGKPVAHHQGNAFAIAEAAAMLDGARISLRAAGHRIDAGAEHAGLWATLAYLDAIEASLFVTDHGVQLLGGHGYIEDHPAEKWFREARALAQILGCRDGALDDAEASVALVPDPLLG